MTTSGTTEPMSQLEGEETLKLVGFRIEDWRFAVRLEQVQTSIMPCSVTRVFHVPPFVRGIISLRGTIVGVLDFGRLLGVSSAQGAHRRFLIVSSRGTQAAIPVHDVFRIPDLPASMIGELPPSVLPVHKQYLEGIINTSSMPEAASVEGEAHTITLVDAEMVFEAPAIRSLRGRM